MFSYVKVLCVSTITKNIPQKKFKERDLFFVSFQTFAGSGYYGIECLYRTIRNLKTKVRINRLAIVLFKARSPFVLKHTTSIISWGYLVILINWF